MWNPSQPGRPLPEQHPSGSQSASAQTAGVQAPNPDRAAGRGMRRWGRILSILGGALLALSVIGGIILAVSGFGNVTGDASESQVFSGTTTITVEQGHVIQLYAEEGRPAPVCEVVGSDGLQPTVGTQQSSSITQDGISWESFDSFASSSTQDYTITCDPTTSQVMVAPPVSIGSIFAGLGGILLGVLGGGLGLLLLVLGLILFFVGRSRGRQADHTR